MRIGLYVDEQGPTLDALTEQTRAAAADGFDSVWLGQRTGRDALTALAVIGREAPGPELGVAVLPTYPRHPLALAGQALTVQEATGGRLALGVGVSHRPVIEGQFGLSYERPARHLREYLTVLGPLLRGESVDFQGETLRVTGSAAVPGVPAPALLVGALGPRTLRITGELADGAITTWAGPATLSGHVLPLLTGAGLAAPRVVAVTCVCVTSDEPGRRAQVAETFGVAARLPAYRAVFEREGAAGPQDVVVVGDETAVERRLRELADAGATDLQAVLIGSPEEQSRTRALLRALNGSP